VLPQFGIAGCLDAIFIIPPQFKVSNSSEHHSGCVLVVRTKMPIIATCFRVLILCCIVTQTGELACRLFYRLLHGLLQCLLLRLGHCGLCAALSCFKERCIYCLRTTATAALLFTSFIVQVKTCFVMNSGNCCLSVSIWESRRYLV